MPKHVSRTSSTFTISSKGALVLASLRASEGIVTVLEQVDGMKTATARWIARGVIVRGVDGNVVTPSSDPRFLGLLERELRGQFPMFNFALDDWKAVPNA